MLSAALAYRCDARSLQAVEAGGSDVVRGGSMWFGQAGVIAAPLTRMLSDR